MTIDIAMNRPKRKTGWEKVSENRQIIKIYSIKVTG
jgi:hypothetical protein